MVENRCFRCEASENEAELFDAIYENEIVKICKKCAKLEAIPVLKRPSSIQLEEAERPYSVYERLAKAAGLKDKAELMKEQISKKYSGVSLDKLRKPNFLQKQTKSDLKDKLNLIDNFHWNIFRARRDKRLTQKDVADKLGVKEEDVKALEYGQLNDNSEEMIRKLENFLEINLRKKSYIEKVRHLPMKEKKIEEIEKEAEQLVKAEQEGEQLLDELQEEELKELEVSKPLDFNEETTKQVTIGDLQKMEGENITKQIQEAGQKSTTQDITLADLQERRLQEKKLQESEQEWEGKTKEEREMIKDGDWKSKENTEENEYGDVEIVE